MYSIRDKQKFIYGRKKITKKEFNAFFHELKILLFKFFDELDTEKKELVAAE